MSEPRFRHRGLSPATHAQPAAEDAVSAPDSIHLRRAERSDIAALLALEGAVFDGDRLRERQFRHHLSNRSGDLIVAYAGSELLGYALLLRRRSSRVARIYSIAVDGHARGHGIGMRLLEFVEGLGREHGAKELRLEVRQDNAGALRLYQRAGYSVYAVYLSYYEDGASAWRLRKVLCPV